MILKLIKIKKNTRYGAKEPSFLLLIAAALGIRPPTTNLFGNRKNHAFLLVVAALMRYQTIHNKVIIKKKTTIHITGSSTQYQTTDNKFIVKQKKPCIPTSGTSTRYQTTYGKFIVKQKNHLSYYQQQHNVLDCWQQIYCEIEKPYITIIGRSIWY